MENLLREKLKIADAAIRLEYFQHLDARKMRHSRAILIDEILQSLFAQWAQQLPQYFLPSLLAVGGYGRGELYPSSDIDVLLLMPTDDFLTDAISDFVAQMWDLGLNIAHSVRTLAQSLKAASDEPSVYTALLEGRFLAGDKRLFLALKSRLKAVSDPVSAFRLKRFEQQERHQRFNNTPYNLEPNIKESPGGLRDLQGIVWLAEIAGFGNSFEALAQNGLLSADGLKIVQEAQEFLAHLRIRLHYLTKRQEDRLLFDFQAELAKSFGFEGKTPQESAAHLMQHYYQNAKVVILLSRILTQSIWNAFVPELVSLPQAIDENFQQKGDALDVRDSEVFQKNPSLIFKTFLILQESPDLKGMTANTFRALWQARGKIDEKFRQNNAHQQQFLALFQAKQNVVRELSRLHLLNLLGFYLPTFQKIIGQMQYDLFHAYTVDQHIFQTLAHLEGFGQEECAHEYPLMSRLFDGFESPWLLYIAALFHDIAKGRGGDHAELSAIDADDFCRLHNIPKKERLMIVWLVRYHLKMSLTAQKEDLSDPKTIARFADFVGDLTHLNALYLLTHADIRATGPNIWNAWKGKLLEDLYFATASFLSENAENAQNLANKGGIVALRKKEVLKKLRYFALPTAVESGLWASLDDVYFMRHTAEEIAWHTHELHYRFAESRPIVATRIVAENSVQVMVYTPDRADLFTHLVGFFARQNFSVADAKIHTTLNNYALDTFILFAQNVQRRVLKNLDFLLLKRLSNFKNSDAPILHTRLSRQLKYFPLKPNIRIVPEENKQFYRLYITASDRLGLLYLIASELNKAKIVLHSARILTMGERVEDVFLISGTGLNDENMRLKLEKDLFTAIQN